MNFNPAAAVSVLINHNHHINNNGNNNNNNNNSISINNNNIIGSDSESFHPFDSLHTPLTSHSKSMEWTNDDALELIEQYRGHTELWNRGDPKYKDKLCRFRAWSEIAERFGCSKAEVERKMNVLLTQYRREKHKMLVKIYQGIQPSPSKWYAFKRFDFMEAGSAGHSGGVGGGSSSGRSRSNSGSANSAGISGDNGNDSGAIGISGTNGHTIAAAALNELRNFDSTTSAVAAVAAAAAASSSSTSSAALSSAAATQHHHHPQAQRRFKSKEMKYFGAMGLSLPMLIANTQTLDTWNSVGQFSPPIGGAERNQLRVPLPMAFSTAPAGELGVGSTTGLNVFGGGGGSSSSDVTASPQKPMETNDIDIDERDVKHEHHNASSIESTEQKLQIQQQQQQPNDAAGICGVSGGSGLISNEVVGSGNPAIVGIDVRRESGSSPLPNTNTHEAHTGSRQSLATHNPAHSSHRQHDPRSDQEDLDIKEELVDYFHAPHPPAPPGSHRSYSSTEERLGGGGGGGSGGGGGTGTDSDDFAQDLRISAAAVAAAAKGLDFSRFVLPRNLRRSTDSNEEEKYTPLNMRKLTTSSGASTSAANVGSNAGQMLMSTLLSHESLSEDTNGSGRGVNGSGIKSDASTSAAAAAAALYAESLNKDDCDFIGANVSLKLRSMDRDQRIIAEKLISEVLFYGQFNELERTARIHPK